MLGDALQVVNAWEQLTGVEAHSAWAASSGSELEVDDVASHPITVSSGAWNAITAAVSHLGTLRDALFHRVSATNVRAMIQTFGQLTVVRGALENACLSIWLLEPDLAADRILRRMQEDWEEVRQLEVVRKEIGSTATKTMADRERDLSGILIKVGANPSELKKRPGYGEIVKVIGGRLSVGAKTTFVLWKACSAVAHGELRGMIAYLKHEDIGSLQPGMQLRKVTGNVELMVTAALVAIEATREALKLYAARSGATYTA